MVPGQRTSYVYVKVDENHRPNAVFYKTPGRDAELIFEEKDPRFYVHVGKSADGTWLEIHTGQNDEDEVHLLPANDPQGRAHIGFSKTRGP